LVPKALRCEQLTARKGNSVTLSPIQFFKLKGCVQP